MIAKVKFFFKRHYVIIAQVVAIGIVVVALAVLTSSLYQVYDHRPPIHLIPLDPENLGGLCPGIRFVISTNLDIIRPTIISYHISVMNKTQEKHLIGTQESFDNLPYPVKGRFFQSFPWTVPKLPPGEYARILGAIDTNGASTPEMAVSLFSIRHDCKG